ncbi:hypothetical protein [Cerasicoccus maritimus]|uniref:hypothetical protein n=1 Tax=Cerasicoccus maritimus TaxID=490089 RepID=UPI0028525B1A|nr:hypothetical protein [Cerasicoccus maritimus]
MAESPAHKFGQMIGNMLEEIIFPFLKEFSDEYGYYVDQAGLRGKARAGKKVKWQDKYGNDHDLDFVIEDGGSKDVRGRPLAFIEAAWRRYTKHSRNKAQEIQGAVLPIAEHYAWDAPFLGAVVAGIFTESSLQQLKSVGFNVLYFSYDSIISAFCSVGIDAEFDEATPDEDFARCIQEIKELNAAKRQQLKDRLKDLNATEITVFIERLRSVLTRSIQKIIISPLFGSSSEFSDIEQAVSFLGGRFDIPARSEFRKIEIIVVYTNGDKIEGSFATAEKGVKFLEYAQKE